MSYDYATLAPILRRQGYRMIRTLPSGSQEWRKGEATRIVAFQANGTVYFA